MTEINRPTSILITGAGGFVGQHLVSRLIREDGLSLSCADLRESVQTDSSRCKWICADLSLPGWTAALDGQFDAVIHLAQSRRYREFPEGTEDMVRINIDATSELLEWCRKNGAKRLVFASTGNVYRPANRLLRETDACEPTSMYAASKLCAEHLIQQYTGFFQATVLRLFGIYGPGQHGMTIPSMIGKVRTGSEITLAKGKGLCITPLYVSDCVEMVFRLLLVEQDCRYDVFNIAGREVLDLGAIANLIGRYIRKAPNSRVTDAEPTYLKGDAKKLYTAIGYEPRIAFKEGIARTLEAEELT